MAFTLSASLIALLPIFAQFAAAAPTPIGVVPLQFCTPAYTISSQSSVSGTPFLGSITCPGGNGDCALSYSVSYEVGVAVEVGADLGLDFEDILSVGISTAVTISTATSTQEAGQRSCPAGAWTCALVITPMMQSVSGEATLCTATPTGSVPADPAPYTVEYPRVDEANNSLFSIDICSCPNFLSWADNGAPWPCPFNC